MIEHPAMFNIATEHYPSTIRFTYENGDFFHTTYDVLVWPRVSLPQFLPK